MKNWITLLGEGEDFNPSLSYICTYETADIKIDLYNQANGPGTYQRLMLAYPADGAGPFPGIAVPFYFPEAMLGFDPATGEELPFYRGITMLTDLAKRGYGAVCADAYHLTYVAQDRSREDFNRWRVAAEALREREPGLTGMGKLVADTRLLLDFLEADPRIDSARLGIAGHSLGGKMAFYTGCLDRRVKAILASDFGMPWDSTNWNDSWYWGAMVEDLRKARLDHTDLLGCGGGVPFCLLAGKYDGPDSLAMMRAADGYDDCPEKLRYIWHDGGHRPTAEALAAGYRFLDKWVKGVL